MEAIIRVFIRSPEQNIRPRFVDLQFTTWKFSSAKTIRLQLQITIQLAVITGLIGSEKSVAGMLEENVLTIFKYDKDCSPFLHKCPIFLFFYYKKSIYCCRLKNVDNIIKL